jgi:glycosyltransferase involved in cell wall biosynthesis
LSNYSNEIDVVLNVFKRQDYLQEQIDSIAKQSIKPSKIWIWNNGSKIDSIIAPDDIEIITANCSSNLGVWSRFIYGLNSTAKYIAFFDDDTIPGSRWFENCMHHIGDNIILGSRGIVFASRNSYSPYIEYGWNSPNRKIKQVDIVGHAWFFSREVLNLFFEEYSKRHYDSLSGEDIHLSYSVQKNGGKTFVPPHPKDDLELWGSRKEFSMVIGSDENSISLLRDSDARFTRALTHYLEQGFNILTESSSIPALIIDSNLKNNESIKSFLNKHPKLKSLVRSLKDSLKKIGIYF